MTRYVLAWFPMLALAIANGALRQVLPSNVRTSGTSVIHGKSFVAFNGTYRLSKSFSLSRAFEKPASNSKNARQMKEMSNAVETMEREGHALEAFCGKKVAGKQHREK